MGERYDAVVIGAGPGGEVVAGRLPARGLRVALVERELIGGECGYWACIPSKTLLRPAEVRFEARRAAGTDEPGQRFADVAAYRDEMIRHLDDSRQVEGYREQGVDVYKGEGRIVAPGRVEVDGEVLEAERIILATGSATRVPPIEGLEQAGFWTNREATTFSDVPASAVVLGGGPVGIEVAQILRRYGAEVTLVQARDRLLPREDEAVGELLAEALRADGIDVRLGARVKAVSSENGRRVARLDGGETVSSEVVVVGTGRVPRVEGLGLEKAGVEADPEGGVAIDERCRAAEGVWAVGDVTGVMPFTHVAKYQARIACADIAGEDVRTDYRGVPRVVFSDPEVAAVGLTERGARERGIDVAVARVDLAETIARPVTYESTPRGDLAVVADRERQVVVGAWGVGPLAGEWIHYAALAIKSETPLRTLRDSVAQFPTFAEGYINAFEQLR